MFDEEEWRPIDEFPHYIVSSHGRVRHTTRTDVRTITINERGFPVILLSSATSPSRYLRQVNKLVAVTFLPEPFYAQDTSIWHKDGDLTNCHADNLMWEMRKRVLEWNEMHRSGKPSYPTPKVRNNRTGVVYENAFECAMHEGVLESAIVWRIERQATSVYDDHARYRYIVD
jgi:hypothetical protein